MDDDEDVEIDCDQCGRLFKCTELRWTNDPYQEDVNNKITECSWWCDDCYQDAIYEI